MVVLASSQARAPCLLASCRVNFSSSLERSSSEGDSQPSRRHMPKEGLRELGCSAKHYSSRSSCHSHSKTTSSSSHGSDHKGSRDSGKGDRHTKKQWFTPSPGFCKRLESWPPVTGHPWFQLRPWLSSRPRAFAGADTMLLAAVANTASSSPGCYGQHAVQVPQ